MNKGIIRYIIGISMMIYGGFMLIPYIVSLIYGEAQGVYFLNIGAASFTVGAIIAYCKKYDNNNMFSKEGLFIVAICWIIFSLIGALPFYLSGEIPDYIDALFEICSGFTTTGATILPVVENLSKCMLFWRCFSIWLGGMGILVFIMAILPLAGGQHNMHLMKAESTGPMVGKLVPKLKNTASLLYTSYFLLTILEFVFLLIGKMSVFDALTLSFSTIGTGGFTNANAGIGVYSNYIQNVIAIFMVLGGTNFSLYFYVVAKKFKDILHLEEVFWYIGILAVSTLFVSVNVLGGFASYSDSLHHSFFQVSSIMTSTGFTTVDYDLWPEFSKTILVIVMCIGACAGSTGGGFKVIRVLVLTKHALNSMSKVLHPRNVKTVLLGGKRIEDKTLASIGSYLFLYICIFILSVLIISLDGFDFFTNFSSVAATFNNTGPGFNLVGPTMNYANFSHLSKVVLVIDMLAGRLEIFPILVLFSPSFWTKR